MAQQILGTDVQLGSIITENGIPYVVTAIQGNTITKVPVPGPNPTAAVTATSGNVKAVNGQDNVPNVQFSDGTIQATAASTTAVGGSTTQVQFNDGGVLGGSAGLVYAKASGLLTATILSGGGLRVTTTQTPASAAATGVAGTIEWDTGFLYVCVATNTWLRVAIATW